MALSLELLEEVENEIKRFSQKLKEAKIRFKEDKYASYSCKESGAIKRSAMDLKNELTKITK